MAEKYNNENYTMYNEIEKTGKQTLVNSQTDIVFKGIFLKSKRALANLISSVIAEKIKPEIFIIAALMMALKMALKMVLKMALKKALKMALKRALKMSLSKALLLHTMKA